MTVSLVRNGSGHGSSALYFRMGLNYREIMCALAANHRIIISLRTLKRSLRSQHLFRRKYYTDVLDIARFVSDQLRESGGLHGYRWMHLKCRQAGFVTTRQVVYTIMQILDKDGVELRRKGRLKRRKYFAMGPNYLWHLVLVDVLMVSPDN